MARIRNTVQIHRPADEVFDYLVDMRNELQWNPNARAVSMLTDGPVNLHTRFKAKWARSRPVIVEVVAYDRPVSWACHSDGPITYHALFTLAPGDQRSTFFTSTFDVHAHGWASLAFRAFVLFMRRQERTNTANIKAALEASRPDPVRGNETTDS